METRSQDHFIYTYTGKKFWPLDPHPEDIDIEDIAHALAMSCRYTGHSIRLLQCWSALYKRV